jgi:LmbE family N-acetylglucosaminyl deacetylase
MILGILTACCALGAVVCLLRIHLYHERFRLAARRTDRLACRVDQGAIPVRLAPDGFDLPGELKMKGRTVLLQLCVHARMGGRLLDPCIEMSDGSRAFRQYFERGAVGQRYLNLSPLFPAGSVDGPRRVRLSGQWIRWQSNASLLIHDAPASENATVLVLAPHPDDAEIAAFGMYACHRSWIITLTAGEKSTAQLPPETPADERARSAAAARISDSLAVPGLGGVPEERRVNLVCPDGALEAMHREPSRPFYLACERSLGRRELRAWNHRLEFRTGGAGCTWNELVGELRGLLEAAQPDIVICPHPLVDTHPDHIFTTVALEQAMTALGRAPLILLYAVHNRHAPSYPFGPSESVVGLLPGDGKEWIAESVYSHPLEAAVLRAKRVALATMYATRTPAAAACRSIRRRLRTATDRLAGTDTGPTSFLRRAPRPNEMYYLLRGADLTGLVHRTLARRSAVPQ